MLVQFQINYKTHFGQQLMLTGSIPQLGEGKTESAVLMTLKDAYSGTWITEIDLKEAEDFSYHYFVKDNNLNTSIEEWGPHRIFRAENRNTFKILVKDFWRSMGDHHYILYSTAFTRAIFKPNEVYKPSKPKATKSADSIIIRFKPHVSRIKGEHRLVVSGSAQNMGNWDEDRAVKLGNTDYPQWYADVIVNASEFPIHYKYLVQNKKGNTEFWETAENRIIYLPEGELPDVIEIADEKLNFPKAPWKGAGVAIPVFSLRCRDGFGVGEFSDIKKLVDWAVKTGLKVIQILPVNDTVAKHTWQDSYPYAAISVYALHPVYISLMGIGKLKSKVNQKIIEAQGKYLNSLSKIDYEAVMVLKSRYFKLIYDETRDAFFKDKDFKAFFKANEHWLRPYAAFSYLRDLFNTPDFSRWGEYSKISPKLLLELTDEKAEHFDEIAVHYFIQYHAHCQLLDAAEYARTNGVVLKGDIPIGIYRNSVDAWQNPKLYHMDCQAGAPPDDFSVIGQNWRFPTYNWDEMAKDNYLWWQQRLQQLSLYFDAFRIDHILGFFRIWEIPLDQTEGLMGYFNPSIPYYLDELQNRGLWFDEQRMCKPYIREHFLHERFGDLTDYVKHHFLFEYASGCYELKEDYSTQQKIEQKLSLEPDASAELRNRNERIIRGLNSLVSEIIFIKAPGTGGKAYFPRHTVHHTRSYQELDNHSKYLIYELYVDYFYKRNEEFWRGKAMTKLPALKKATNMLLCGEDLGMVPACVPAVMDELGILSLEVQRMPKNPKITFGHPAHYPYLSVATPSSHDTSTIRGWWKENYNQTQRYFNEILGNHGDAPKECTPEMARQIVLQHLYSPSMLTIFPLQDLLAMDDTLRFPDVDAERINQPSNPNHYWRYRMHLNIEDLLEQDNFNKFLWDQVQGSDRMKVY